MASTVSQTLRRSGRVVRFVFERGERGQTVVVHLRQSADSPTETVVRFVEVTALRFFRSESTVLDNLSFGVEDLAANGLERARYYVKDLEEEFVTFYCGDIEVSEG